MKSLCLLVWKRLAWTYQGLLRISWYSFRLRILLAEIGEHFLDLLILLLQTPMRWDKWNKLSDPKSFNCKCACNARSTCPIPLEFAAAMRKS